MAAMLASVVMETKKEMFAPSVESLAGARVSVPKVNLVVVAVVVLIVGQGVSSS